MEQTLAEQKTQLTALFESVTDIGNVFDRNRYIETEKEFRDIFTLQMSGKKKRQMRILMFQQSGVQDVDWGEIEDGREERSWEGIMMMGVVDADDTKTAFDNLIESVRAKWNSTGWKLLNGTVHDKSSLTFGSVEEGVFVGVLIHIAKFDFTTYVNNFN